MASWFEEQRRKLLKFNEDQTKKNKAFFDSDKGKQSRAAATKQLKTVAKIGGGVAGMVGKAAIRAGVQQVAKHGPEVIDKVSKAVSGAADTSGRDVAGLVTRGSKALADIGKPKVAGAGKKVVQATQQALPRIKSAAERVPDVTARKLAENTSALAKQLANRAGRPSDWKKYMREAKKQVISASRANRNWLLRKK